MKKILVASILLAGITSSSYGQGFYFRAGLGLDIAQSGQSMYDTPIPYNGFPTGINGSRQNAGNVQTYSISGASFGSGIPVILGFGYMFNNNVGVQLDGGLGLFIARYTFNDMNAELNNGTGTTTAYNIKIQQSANTPFFLMPSLVLQTGDQVKIYSRFGFALPLSASITQEEMLTNAPGTGALVTDDFTWKLKTSFSLGFTAAAGVKYQISDKLSIWGELNMLSMSLYAKEQDLKSWTESSQGTTLNVPLINYTNAQTIKFSKTAVLDSTLSSMPTYSIPFSNVGIHFGITFNLGEGHGSSGHSHAKEEIDPNKPFRRR